jgi:hypothetical protein
MNTGIIVMLVLPMALFVSACSGQGGGSLPVEERVSDAQLHALMSDQINVLVRQIDMLILDQHRTAVELDQERRRKAVQVANAASGLQRSADLIIAMQPQLSLTPESAAVFAQLALQFREQGVYMEDLARQNRFDVLQSEIETARATCQACHNLYRED